MPTKTRNTHWVSASPTQCDHCHFPIHKEFVFAATTKGRWGRLHPACHRDIGIGIGQGRGQRYELQTYGRWLQVEG